MFVLKARPIDANPGVLDEVHTAMTKKELIEWYNGQRVPPFYHSTVEGGRKIPRHHNPDGPLFKYLPLNPHEINSDGAGIYEDSSRRALFKREFELLKAQLRSSANTHPLLVHQLAATIDNGGPLDDPS